MKVLVIYDGYIRIGPAKGGIPAALFNLTKAIVQEGHEVTILERKDKDSDSTLEQIDGIRFVRLNVKKRAAGGNDVLYRFPFGLIRVVIDGLAWAYRANRWLGEQGDAPGSNGNTRWQGKLPCILPAPFSDAKGSNT